MGAFVHFSGFFGQNCHFFGFWPVQWDIMALAKLSPGFPNATGFLAQNWHSCPAFRCRDPSRFPAPFRGVAAQLSVCVGVPAEVLGRFATERCPDEGVKPAGDIVKDRHYFSARQRLYGLKRERTAR